MIQVRVMNAKKLLYILGGQATGKMTVGEELSKITGLKLFHVHLAVELAHHFYGYEVDVPMEEKEKHKLLFAELSSGIQEIIHRNIAKSYHAGMIATFVMRFDSEYAWEHLERLKKIFIDTAKDHGEKTEFYCVELICDIEERKRRNITPHRLEQKPSKRNIDFSSMDMENTMLQHRIFSTGDEISRFSAKQYLKIDNTNLSAIDVASIIYKTFKLISL